MEDTKLSAYVPIQYGTLRLLTFIFCFTVGSTIIVRRLPEMPLKILVEMLVFMGAILLYSVVLLQNRPTVFVRSWWQRNVVGYTVWYWEEESSEKVHWKKNKELRCGIVRRNAPCPRKDLPCFFLPLGGWFQSATNTYNLVSRVMHPLGYGITHVDYIPLWDSPMSILLVLKHSLGEVYKVDIKTLFAMLTFHFHYPSKRGLDRDWTTKFFDAYTRKAEQYELLKATHTTMCNELLDAYEFVCKSSRLQHTDEGKRVRDTLNKMLTRLHPEDPAHVRFMQIELANAERKLKKKKSSKTPTRAETSPDEVA